MYLNLCIPCLFSPSLDHPQETVPLQTISPHNLSQKSKQSSLHHHPQLSRYASPPQHLLICHSFHPRHPHRSSDKLHLRCLQSLLHPPDAIFPRTRPPNLAHLHHIQTHPFCLPSQVIQLFRLIQGVYISCCNSFATIYPRSSPITTSRHQLCMSRQAASNHLITDDGYLPGVTPPTERVSIPVGDALVSAVIDIFSLNAVPLSFLV